MNHPEELPREKLDGGASAAVEVELAQSLGLSEALAIGIGTMIGAGIFVLPGFILAEVGPAAVLSFLLGGIIALLNAMAAAEVATGMPKSGGGYYFISRALGPLWGAVLGWGSWFGLIFASAFYMVGFGEYVHTVVGLPVIVYALGMTVILTGLNLVGSRAAGQFQNFTVAVLVAVLLLFLGRGSAAAEPSLPLRIGLHPLRDGGDLRRDGHPLRHLCRLRRDRLHGRGDPKPREEPSHRSSGVGDLGDHSLRRDHHALPLPPTLGGAHRTDPGGGSGRGPDGSPGAGRPCSWGRFWPL